MAKDKKTAASPAEQEIYKSEGHFKAVVKRMLGDPKTVVGFIILLIYAVIAIFCYRIAPMNPNAVSADILAAPGVNGHIFGTDHLGRDLFSRTIIGTRYSIVLGLGATLFMLFAGLVLGSIAGYVGGWFDEWLMRFMDVIQSVPGTLLNMALATAFGAGFFKLMLAMGIGGTSSMIRLQRSCVLSIRKMEYIDAASAANCSFFRKITKHIIPNALAQSLVMATSRIGGTIIAAAGLSFLGCGMPANTPEWGALLSSGRDYIKNAPYLCLYPGIMLVIFVLASNLVGDGLRDALDPKLKK